MLRRWVSIVLTLRNSSRAISGLVRRSTTRRATWISRCVSVSTPVAVHVRGSGAAVHVAPEFAQLALGLLAVADRAACVELLDGPLEFGHGTRCARRRARVRGRRACARERPRRGRRRSRPPWRRSARGRRRWPGLLVRARPPRRRGVPSPWSRGGPAPRPWQSRGAPRARPRRVGRPRASSGSEARSSSPSSRWRFAAAPHLRRPSAGSRWRARAPRSRRACWRARRSRKCKQGCRRDRA